MLRLCWSSELPQSNPEWADLLIASCVPLGGLSGLAEPGRACAGLLFEWLYPAHLPTLRSCLEAWADSPDVTTAMLKFMAEFALNKTQRLTFDSSSPNGILLFREVSKVWTSIAERPVQWVQWVHFILLRIWHNASITCS